MVLSAVVMGITGTLLIFMPQEVSRFLNLAESAPILFQILGSLYFGFGMLNWTAKANVIGGIYSRPVAIGNFTHFLTGGLAFIKSAMHTTSTRSIWICAIVYLKFTLFFGWIFCVNPISANKRFI